jgi:hypothetical protein
MVEFVTGGALKILHLSDLHISEPFATLTEVWQGPAAHLNNRKFAAIIISGDLSRRAAQDEYEELLAFANETLLNLVLDGDRRRIVFVPGNHDVDWSRNVYRHQPNDDLLFREGAAAVNQALVDFERRGGRSRCRVYRTPLGRSEIYEIDRENYPSRFANVQRFFRSFYAPDDEEPPSEEKVCHRCFDLTNEGQDWSVHILKEERLVIAGFNSCYNNDRYWSGAHINPTAVAAAQRIADDYDPECLKVAVWHHGLQSDEYRPDHLPLLDIGNLFNAGFRIGFHGHLHRSDSGTFGRLFGGRLAIVSTGSLAAGPADRPDAAPNEFTIATVNPSQVRAETFARQGTAGIYVSQPPRTIILEPRDRRESPLTVADTHIRTYHLSSDGIVHVTVRLTRVRVSGPLVLGVLTGPFCTAQARPVARSPLGDHPVEHKELPDGRLQFTMHDQVGEELEYLEWEYSAANAFALDTNDLLMRDLPQREHIAEGWEARPHTVRVLSNSLSLCYTFDDEEIAREPSTPVVLRKCAVDGVTRTRRVPEEENRCVVTSEGATLRLNVEMPIPGFRYCASYRPRSTSPLPRLARAIAQILLDAIRQNDHSPLLDDLRGAVESLVEIAIGSGLAALRSHALLWSDRTRRLETGFGRIPPGYWPVRFASGSGVAGHAFRFSRVAAWHRESQPSTLVYLQSAEGQQWAPQHEWIICVPILLAPKGPSIGVVSFEGGTSNADAGEAGLRLGGLARLSRDDAQQGTESATSVEKRSKLQENILLTVVNQAFWAACAHERLSGCLSPDDQRFAMDVLLSLDLAGEPSSARSTS